MPLNEAHGGVTRAFDAWRSTESDIRAYVELSDRWVIRAYDLEWAAAQSEFEANFDPHRHDVDGHVDVFHERVGGLWADDYLWMLRSGALRDAVSAYEVYAENSLRELLQKHWYQGPLEGERCRFSLKVADGQMSPPWGSLQRVHGALGAQLETANVKYVRTLRHLLTHQRGRLRTAEQREQFVAEGNENDWLVGGAFVGGDVPLSSERVLQMLGQLDEAVRACDRRIFPVAWGDRPPPSKAFHGLTLGRRPALEYLQAD